MKAKDYKAILSTHLTKEFGQEKYVVVDKDGNVLDNNKGEGFNTEDKALYHYEIKTFGKTSRQKEKFLGKKEKEYSKKALTKHALT